VQRRELFEHSDVHQTVSYNGRLVAYYIASRKEWRTLPSGEEAVDRATNHAITSNPNDIAPGELRRAICDTLENSHADLP
jgi:hypothetical protein